MSVKRQRKGSSGDIVAIDLGDGYESYACVLDPPLMGFYEIRSRERLSIEQITSSKFLFKVFVYNQAITSGSWKKIGRISLPPHLKDNEHFFRQDILSGELYIHIDGREKIPALRRDVNGLEAAAVWHAEHVEDRIRDFHNGVENVWAKLVNAIKED